MSDQKFVSKLHFALKTKCNFAPKCPILDIKFPNISGGDTPGPPLRSSLRESRICQQQLNVCVMDGVNGVDGA